MASELGGYKLDLVSVQEVKFDYRVAERAEDFVVFYGQGKENNKLGTGCSIHNRKVSELQRLDFVSGKM